MHLSPSTPREIAPRHFAGVAIFWRFLIPLLCLGLGLVLAFSPGFFEADELTHFLLARDAWHSWDARLDIWGRPACTNLYALLTPWGLTAARLLALGITVLVALGTMRLSRLALPQQPSSFFRRYAPAWLCLLLLAQPHFLLNAATVMTEMLLAASWVWAAVFLLQRRPLLASFILGLGGLARPEGFFAIAAWPLFLAFYDRPFNRQRIPKLLLATFLAGLPVLIWYLTGVGVFLSLQWPLQRWPWSAVSQYGASFKRFFESLLLATGIWTWIPMLLAAIQLHIRRLRTPILLVLLPMGCFLLLHGILGGLGLFGSMALPRYYIAIVPMMAILALYGLALAETRLPAILLALLAAVCALAPVLYTYSQGMIPVPLPTDAKCLSAAVDALEQRYTKAQLAERLIAGNPWVVYRLGFSGDSPVARRAWTPDAVRTAPLGTLVLVDNALWQYERGPKDAELEHWGYIIRQDIQPQIDKVPQVPDVATNKVAPEKVIVRVWERLSIPEK